MNPKIQDLKQHGLSPFFVVNGRGGNLAPLAVITSKLRDELGVKVATMMYLSGRGRRQERRKDDASADRRVS